MHFRLPAPLLFSSILSCLILFGCAPAVQDNAADTSTQSTEAEDREAILAQSRELSAAYLAGDIPRLIQVYSEDGVAGPAGREFVIGHTALEQLWRLPEGRTILEHESIPDRLVIDGDHAYDYGHYRGQAAQDGEPMDPFGGAYVIVWERGEDDVWRIAVDMWYNLPQDS